MTEHNQSLNDIRNSVRETLNRYSCSEILDDIMGAVSGVISQHQASAIDGTDWKVVEENGRQYVKVEINTMIEYRKKHEAEQPQFAHDIDVGHKIDKIKDLEIHPNFSSHYKNGFSQCKAVVLDILGDASTRKDEESTGTTASATSASAIRSSSTNTSVAQGIEHVVSTNRVAGSSPAGGSISDTLNRCPACGTHEISLERTCHNSACKDYAKAVTVYEGWRITKSDIPSDTLNRCPACGGNDADMPCAYPREKEAQPGCLRNKRQQGEIPVNDDLFPVIFEAIKANIQVSKEAGGDGSSVGIIYSITKLAEEIIKALPKREAQSEIPVNDDAKALFMHLWACRAANGTMWIDQPDVAKLHAAFNSPKWEQDDITYKELHILIHDAIEEGWQAASDSDGQTTQASVVIDRLKPYLRTPAREIVCRKRLQDALMKHGYLDYLDGPQVEAAMDELVSEIEGGQS